MSNFNEILKISDIFDLTAELYTISANAIYRIKDKFYWVQEWEIWWQIQPNNLVIFWKSLDCNSNVQCMINFGLSWILALNFLCQLKQKWSNDISTGSIFIAILCLLILNLFISVRKISSEFKTSIIYQEWPTVVNF